MTGLPERLTAAAKQHTVNLGEVWNLLQEAAEEIERLNDARIWHQSMIDAVNARFQLADRRGFERALACCSQFALQIRDEADSGKWPDVRNPDWAMGLSFGANMIGKRLRAIPYSTDEGVGHD